MNHQTRVYENIFETLPSEENPTPLVRINKLNPCAEFPLYAKLEWVNPFGSVKDRAAWELLRDLEERGERASHTWFVLKYLLGLPNVKSYDGSWTEYGSIVGAPIEK